MHLQRLRPLVVAADFRADPCASCDIRHRSVCNAIGEADLAHLAAAAVSVQIDKRRVFIEEGQEATSFYNITQGTVKLFKQLPDGRQQITGFAGIGHFLGLAARSTYAFSAEAVEPVRLCRFSRSRLKQLLDDFPQLERRLLETACSELASAQEQMLLLGRKSARERVASFLAARRRQEGTCSAVPCGTFSNRIMLPMSRGEIADYLGLTIETVSRTLSQFKAEKRIGIPSNSEIVILDRTWLEELAASVG